MLDFCGRKPIAWHAAAKRRLHPTLYELGAKAVQHEEKKAEQEYRQFVKGER